MASGKRIVFALAAAIVAAATTDPLVEHLSNAGLFGAGTFTDRSNADVIPALCAGAFFSLAFVVLAVMRLLGSGDRVASWLREPAHDLDALCVRRMLPLVFGLQLVVLFVMETAEQRFALGHLLGGTIWLGAPAPISLCLHLVGCVLVSFVLSRALRMLATRVVDAFRRALQRVTVLSLDDPPALRVRVVELVHVFEPLFRHPTVRPPPLPAA